PGAEKHDVLEPVALIDEFGRHVGMIVDAYLIALEHARQFGARERDAIDVDRRIIAAQHHLPHWGQLIVAVEEDGFHHSTFGSCRAKARHPVPTDDYFPRAR